MGEDTGARLVHGRPVSEEQVQAWADEAEAGYDVAALEQLQARSKGQSGSGRGRGLPTVGAGVVVAVRLDAASVEALMQRVRAGGITTRSTAIRAVVSARAPVDASAARGAC